jgi:hypothetical protein
MEDSFEDMDTPASAFGAVFKNKFTNSPSYLARQSIAAASPFGNNSQFYENRCGEFDSFPILDALNANKLIEHLSYNLKNESYFFDGLELINSYSIKSPSNLTPKSEYEYLTQVGESRKTLCLVRINRRICTLDPELTFSINNLIPGYDPWFTISISYSGTKQFRREALETDNVADFELSMKYKAAMLSFTNAESFIYAFAQLDPSKTVVPSVTELFNQVYSKYKSVTERKWYHEHAPIMPNTKIDNQMYWDDLYNLLRYDKDGTFSWFKDGSNAILNIVRKISLSQNGMTFLYDQFNKDNTCYEIYEHMSGSSEFNGEVVSNKTIFAALMINLCELNIDRILNISSNFKSDKRNKTYINFRISDVIQINEIKTQQYIVDSNIRDKDSKYGYFDLTQIEHILEIVPFSRFPKPSGKIDQTLSLHPLDMVMLDIPTQFGVRILKAYPAIYVKDLAYQKEWADTMHIIRIAADILLVMVPFGIYFKVIKGLSNFLKAVSSVEAAVAGMDLMVMGLEPMLKNSERGREFLKNWENFYTFASVTTGLLTLPTAIVALGNLSVSIGKLLKWLHTTAVLFDQIELIALKALYYALSSSPNFPRLIGQFKLIAGTAIQALFKKAYLKIFDLQEHGVILISVTREKDGKSIKTYYLIYRDVIIAEAATETQMQRAIAPFFGKNDKVLLGALEEFAAVSRIAKNLDAVKLTKLELDEWKKVISRNGGMVRHISESKKMGEFFLKECVGAAFDPFAFPPTIWIRDNPSDLELFHEAMHFEDYLRRGRVNFIRGFEKEVLPFGNKPQPNKRDLLISEYIKEKYVLDRVLEEQQNWIDKFGYGRFTEQEIGFSISYFTNYELDCISEGINVSKIIIKP